MPRSLAVCRELADLLEYPGPELPRRADACVCRIEPIDPAAAALIKEFRQAIQPMSSGQLEEAYTAAFDLQPDRCLYAGHHLFGADCRRNLFLSLLKAHYAERDFSTGCELPDYIPAMLRFASEHEQEAETWELIDECVVPALRKVAASDGLYAMPLRATLRFLTGEAA